jgi:hypothetical protein
MIVHLVRDLHDLECVCGKWKSALTKREQWFTITSLDYRDFDTYRWCKGCSEDPHFQLVLLASTDLGDK